MQSLSVSLEQRSYPIFIGVPTPGEFVSALRNISPPPSQGVVLFDERVAGVATEVADALQGVCQRVHAIEIPSGEGSKSAHQVERLWGEMLASQADRKALLIAVGGGVIGDLVGFVAATWNRGVRFVQVPTTLLAMVDSSVGGKTGINLPQAKNVIGAFWQPSMVWIDLNVLSTLEAREYRSGLAEVVKYGVILDEVFFQYLETHADRILARDHEVMTEIIHRSCALKAEVVVADERETTGLRAVLNYGHTYGHALESLTEYGCLLHGEAVSIGMTMAGALGLALGRWSQEEYRRQTMLLERLGLPTQLNPEWAKRFTPSDLLAAMMHDKKNTYGKLNLILPTKLGHVEIVSDVPIEKIQQGLQEFLAEPPAW